MKIAFLIAYKDFKDEEYFVPGSLLQGAGYCPVAVSRTVGSARGDDGGQVKIRMTFDQLSLKDFSGLILVGGSGALREMDNKAVHRLIKQAIDMNIVLGAICISPLILARSGFLKGRRMTVWSTPMDRWPVTEIKERGIDYVDQPVVIDDRLVTANGPAAAFDFGQALLAQLDKKGN